MTKPNASPKLPHGNCPVADKRGRRRFLGAGTALTPVILTMFSQPALGVTCFTPSRALSKNTSVSQNGKNGICTNAQSPGNYKTQTFSWPIPTTTPFHPTFVMGSGTGTKFTKQVNNNWVSMTMLEVLQVGPAEDPQKVAFHLIGAYLNCLGGGGSNISPLAMTTAGIQKIWSEWVAKGFYEPTAGVKWYAEDIKSYLLSNGIVS